MCMIALGFFSTAHTFTGRPASWAAYTTCMQVRSSTEDESQALQHGMYQMQTLLIIDVAISITK